MLSWVLLILSDVNITSSYSCCIHVGISAQESLTGMKGQDGGKKWEFSFYHEEEYKKKEVII